MAEKQERPRGFYERFLAEKRSLEEKEAEEGSGGKSLAPSRAPDSPVLKELEEKATPNQPGYMRDLRSLHRLIRSGGPDNWASSKWFRFLKDRYPAEYEMLKEEHLGKGKTLREGFWHGRAFAREELEGVNVDEDLVFCENLYPNDAPVAEYHVFLHEADVLLWALAREVARGRVTAGEAWRTWEPYRRLCPHFYTEWEDSGWFPTEDWIIENPAATESFKDDAKKCLAAGVVAIPEEERRDSPFPIGGIFHVGSRAALAGLRRKLSGRYRILVREQGEYLGLSFGLQDVVELLNQEVTAQPYILQADRDPFGADLVYGDIGGRLGLVFLEEGYAADIKAFRSALYKAATWGDLRRMVSKKRYRETVKMWKNHELEAPSPNPDDDFDAESLPGYADGDWPESAPNMMGTWVDDEIIYQYGRYVPATNGFHPVIDFENEEEVVSLLEDQGHICTRDDDLVRAAVWGG
ncbi:MAG: hypothetical protein M3R38_15495 [Actinomycetota bacterium]|nr:hypothetical protein [Actinomycetota bacterium]